MYLSRIPATAVRHCILQKHGICRVSNRSLSQSLRAKKPWKDSQDKHSINTETTEYSKSGTDNSATHDNVAFDPKKTSPEGEKDTAGKGDDVSYLFTP